MVPGDVTARRPPEPATVTTLWDFDSIGPLPTALVVRGDRIYWSTMDGRLLVAPVAGGTPTVLFERPTSGLQTDDAALYFAAEDALYALDHGERKPRRVAARAGAILLDSDDDSLYFAIPGFERNPDHGIYQVAKAGGRVERLFRSSARDQPTVMADDTHIYIASWERGIIYRRAKTGGEMTPFVSRQGRVVSMALDGGHLYWYSEGTGEIRRIAKSGGGKVAVIGKRVDQEPVLADADGVYWFEGGPGPTGYQLMRLTPGAKAATHVAGELNMPVRLVVAGGWAYFGDYVEQRLVRVPLR